MNRETRTDWEVVTARGRTVSSFNSEDLARAYVADRRATVPGLVVFEVVTTIERRAVYRPRLRVVA